MSRIREALKKAALERDVQQGGRTTQELVELAGENLVREVGSELVQTSAVRTVEAPATPFPSAFQWITSHSGNTRCLPEAGNDPIGPSFVPVPTNSATE